MPSSTPPPATPRSKSKYRIRQFNPSKQYPTAQAQCASRLSCKIESVIAWEWLKNMSIPSRTAEDHLLIFIESGQLKAQINNTSHQARTSDLLWVPKNSLREIAATKDSQFIAVHLDIYPSMNQISVDQVVSSVDKHYLNSLKHILHIDDHKSILALTQQLMNSLIQKACLHEIIRITEHQDALIHKAIALLHEEPSLSAELCAQKVGLGITRFRQRFQTFCNTSPGKYITQLRCHLAANLLRNSNDSIASIAVACGYENPNYLYRVFKKYYHCTPQAYREGTGTVEL